VVNRTQARVAPDHAGIFETSLLSALWPDRVQVDQLPSLEDAPANDPGGDDRGEHRHSPSHPLHGVFGPDPRRFDPTRATDLLEDVVDWTSKQVEQTDSPRD
jgi:creatinine amidohydrolase